MLYKKRNNTTTKEDYQKLSSIFLMVGAYFMVYAAGCALKAHEKED